MKKIIQKLSILALILGAFVCVPRAQAQVDPTALVTLTNLPSTVATATATVRTNLVQVKQGQGLAIGSLLTCSSGTTAAVLLCYPSVDGTNWSSQPITLTFPVNGTTATRGATNLSASALAGYRALNFATLTNANAGTLTNSGFIVSRPY